MFYDAEGQLHSMLASWTDVSEQDLLAQASADRSWFRTDDLLRLSSLIGEIKGGLSVK